MSRILIVDDDGPSLEGLRLLLELDGYAVVAMRSSREALERIRTECFDAFVTDLEMPCPSGLELISAARARQPELPIFVMSGHVGSPICDEALVRGARLAFAKPVDYDVLMKDLTRALA